MVAARGMRVQITIGVGTIAVASLALALWGAAPSGAARSCTPKSKLHHHARAHTHRAAPCGGKARYRSRRTSPNSFGGNCKLSGDLVFKTPLGYDVRTTTLTDSASGTCTGRLNGVPVNDIPVVNEVTGTATASCLTGKAHTVDTLIFARRVKILIFTDSVFAATQGLAHTVGAVSGHSVEHVSLLPYVDQSTLAACQAGNLRSARYDLDAKTITPLVG